MIIKESQMQMTSVYGYQRTLATSERISDRVDLTAEGEESPAKQETDLIEISTDAKKANEIDSSRFKLSDRDKLRLQIIQRIFEFISGKKLKLSAPLDLQENNSSSQRLQLIPVSSASLSRLVTREVSQTYQEKEKVAFSAQGIVKTADGREINLDISFNMSRSFTQHFEYREMMVQTIDPLVINFNAPNASLSQEKMEFDLDADGNADSISFVGSGSGFLALDLNEDGEINDGRELFGPQTGNGFNELAQYDSDNNGWIDENDPIYDRLRIWTKNENGDLELLALGEKGVGAIYLGNISTEFAYKDDNNQTDGQLRSSGVFLNENGTAGTIQQIDLVG